MSRGLGKIERKILDYLKKVDSCNGIKKLTQHVFEHDKSKVSIKEPEYQSVCRAVRSLKRKGIVETYKKKRSEIPEDLRYHSGYKSNWHLVIYLKNNDF